MGIVSMIKEGVKTYNSKGGLIGAKDLYAAAGSLFIKYGNFKFEVKKYKDGYKVLRRQVVNIY
ncbi:MAG: hypothetical protein ACRDD7_16960 [Peptostreptococcaceae bacterium]